PPGITISSVCTWLPGGRLSQEILITRSRTDPTLKELAGVQTGSPSSQKVNAALGTGGGGPPPLAEEDSMQPANATVTSRTATTPRRLLWFHRVAGCDPIIMADLIRMDKQSRKRAGRWWRRKSERVERRGW